MLGAKVYATNCKNNGDKINCNCGSLYPEMLKRNVLKFKADIGFAFDGDADRIVAIDNNGDIFDGDKIVYILSKIQQKTQGNVNAVVGTSLTNMGIEKALNDINIGLIRADVGDKYVLEKMLKYNCVIGGEQSGHIIDLANATTGDGILTAVKLSKIIKEFGNLNKIFDVSMFPQHSVNVVVADKLRIINSEILSSAVRCEQEKLNGRILVRASGTEPKIRIMVECDNINKAMEVAKRLENVVKSIN
jgi:phosphoglucosamine mutase